MADRRETRAVLVNPRQQPEYLTWLPQEGELQKCWNLDVGFARPAPPEWVNNVAVRIRAMVRTSDLLFVAGMPDLCPSDDPMAALEGRMGGRLLIVDPRDGRKLGECHLDSPPIFDGLSAAASRLYLATMDGNLLCLAGDRE